MKARDAGTLTILTALGTATYVDEYFPAIWILLAVAVVGTLVAKFDFYLYRHIRTGAIVVAALVFFFVNPVWGMWIFVATALTHYTELWDTVLGLRANAEERYGH